MTTFAPRGPERRSGVKRRVVDVVPTVISRRDRHSGRERRSGTDRRRYLDERWDQLVEAVRLWSGIKHGLLFTVSYVGLANQDEFNE